VDISFLWILATLTAAAAQTARNATQNRLTGLIGTAGATQVRFLYGFPFALLFLILIPAFGGQPIPRPNLAFSGFLAMGAVAQVLATALMLAAMRERTFSTVVAYTKTEPVQVAVFAFAVLGDPLSVVGALAIVIATAGVVAMSIKPGSPDLTGFRPAALGLVSGAFFALAAVGFRGAILSLPDGTFLVRATTTLAWGLGLQTAILGSYLALFDRKALLGSLRVWRPSLFAGFLGAFASQFWFIGFALTSAANVRTLALVEVIFAQIVSQKLFSQTTSRREFAGMALIVGGVGLLLLGH